MRDEAPTRGIKAKAGRENFPVASHLLPRATRSHLMAIYGFARLTDDTGDEGEGDRLLLLDRLQSELDRAFARSASDPIFQELGRTITACRLDKKPLLDLIEANRQDQTIDRYETFEELRDYCRLSADPVGRLVLAVAGALTADRARWSDDVCTGLQLTEHLQDVREDAVRGRIYLPAEDRARFAVEEGELLTPPATQQFARLMAFEVERTRALLGAAVPLAASLRGRIRLAVTGFAAGGFAALDAIQAADYDVLSRSVKGSKRRLLFHTLRLLSQARRNKRRTMGASEATDPGWGENE